MEATLNLMGYELDFPLFGQLLYGGLNPALPANADGPEYQQRMQEMISVPAADRGVYKCAFHPPFNFFKNHIDIIRPLLFAVIGAACIYLFYKCTTEVKQRYLQEDKFDISENLRNTDF
jgi:hypothetical protein